jgi:hypothetical protein
MTRLNPGLRHTILLAALAVPVLLAGCNAQPQTRSGAAAQAACRQRADEVYLMQNRGEIYRADQYATSTRDAPYASSGVVGVTSSGLSGRYARDSLLSDCLSGNHPAGPVTPGEAPAPGTSPAGPATRAGQPPAPRP